MTAAVSTLAGIGLAVLLLLILIGGKSLLGRGWLLLLFFAVYFADNLLILLTNRYPSLRLIPSRTWGGFLICNWSGKLYSVLLVVAVASAARSAFPRSEVGLTLRHRPGWLLPSLVVVAALAAWAAVVGVHSPKGDWDLLTLLYLATMPGLNEELVYRGCLLAILDRLLPGRISLFSAPVGWGLVISSVLFGLLHGFWLDRSWGAHLDVIALRNATFSGLAFAWLKARTGSLALPIVAHGLQDLLFFLPRMV